MAFNWRKWNRIIHRDFGYLFFGMTIIYALSGIAINHLEEWDPRYKESEKVINVDVPFQVNKENLLDILSEYDEGENYRKHYMPNEEYVKIFLVDGEAKINLSTGEGIIKKRKARPLFKETTYLHYDPVIWWTWFSDIYAGALIIIAITGLLILKGKKGITGRGAWMTVLGILIPLIFLIIFYY